MKIIKCLSDLIKDELDASKQYIEKALKYEEKYPEAAKAFYVLSLEEMKHVELLHEEVTKLINRYRDEEGDPPEKMLFLYEYLHEKLIECEKEIRIMQGMYGE